jgi:hypothetical protein
MDTSVACCSGLSVASVVRCGAAVAMLRSAVCLALLVLIAVRILLR